MSPSIKWSLFNKNCVQKSFRWCAKWWELKIICNILNDYDEENNIRDDLINFNLQRKKISSNLKNFDGINDIEDSNNK